MVHICNFSIVEVEVGGEGVNREYGVNLRAACTRGDPVSKNNNNKNSNQHLEMCVCSVHFKIYTERKLVSHLTFISEETALQCIQLL